jgi:hypothetical protein
MPDAAATVDPNYFTGNILIRSRLLTAIQKNHINPVTIINHDPIIFKKPLSIFELVPLVWPRDVQGRLARCSNPGASTVFIE